MGLLKGRAAAVRLAPEKLQPRVKPMRGPMHSRAVWAGLAGFGALALAGLALAQVADDPRPVIAARFPGVAWISRPALAERLGVGDALLLDARTEAEFAVSHLRGARRIDPDRPDLAMLANAPSLVVVYCSIGWRSASVAEALTRPGGPEPRNLEGGIFAWANEGREVVRDGRPVRAVHPYDAVWGRLLRAELHRMTP